MDVNSIYKTGALFLEQVWLMSVKHLHQKQRKGRVFLKETFFIPLFFLISVTNLMFAGKTQDGKDVFYQLISLPPLSTAEPWGVFSADDDGKTLSKNLYYSPNNHQGVEELIEALVSEYPSIKAIGTASAEDIVLEYESHLFNTWAAVEFQLSPEQLSTGLLVPNEAIATPLLYNIMMNPLATQLSTHNFTDTVYNKYSGETDVYWSSGYLTIQNFVSTYCAKQYTDLVPSNYSVQTYLQRYPASPIYGNSPAPFDIANKRWTLWRWIGGTILAICLFTPMLGMLTECVRERQNRMKDLLEISGLLNISYWFSYLVSIVILNQATIWWCVMFLSAIGVFNRQRVFPYAGILTVFSISITCFSLFSGFIIFRSEYYGLPIFITNTALTIAGGFMAISTDMTIGTKLFLCFLHPSIGLTMGVFVIETYLHHHPYVHDNMDSSYSDDSKNYPSLDNICGVMMLSAVVYMLLTLEMPFKSLQRIYQSGVLENWLFSMENVVAERDNEVKYPCDLEGEGVCGEKSASLLKVEELSHIYPDGTHAVKDISFDIKQGEVLSFLGANGAGKSTCMSMLCGALDATFGDATVNGYSITTERTSARRNLGIAMQQDIIWDDVSVEDHLYLFGGLRGMFGAKLREEVDKMVDSLGFPEKRKSMAGTLSGGQKRRLCVGISMVGGNSVVYLDEPTAGLDPVSRRQLWELVQKNRAGRAILLTTHFMDEADVLGDRIAIVKEGRLRALGTSKFLKKRFGMGYLIKMSLTAEAEVPQIVRRMKEFVSETSVASNAGTELSLRLPKEAVSQFPLMLEALERDGERLGVLSYGIETTTLEEVFMRIVNEDSETLINDPAEANRLLAASPEERDAATVALKARDDIRAPLKDNTMTAVLTKGEPGFGNLAQQVRIMFTKRVHQFMRSKGQWSLGLVVPLVIAMCTGAMLSNMPKALLGGTQNINLPVYDAVFSTPVCGPGNETATEQLFENAFGGAPSTYLGTTFQDLNTYVSDIATAGFGASSTNGIYYESVSNFTVMYNASYPMNLAASVTNMLNAATREATGDLLRVASTFQNLPTQTLGMQINSGFLVAILVSLFSGSLGAGMSIVVGGERVTHVKHLQMASGGSKIAYWTANFLFDFCVMFAALLTFTTLLAIFSSEYTNEGFGIVFCGGMPYITASIFQFYVISFWVSDVKLAQTIYFYGSLFVMFGLQTLWIIASFIMENGNVSSPMIQLIGVPLTLVDPAFGWYVIIIFQHNFMGVLTQNEGKELLTEIAVSEFASLFIGTILYFLVLAYLEGGFSCAVFSSSRKVENSDTSVAAVSSILFPSSDVESRGSAQRSKLESRSKLPAVRVFGHEDPDVAAERKKVQAIVDSGTMSAQHNAIFISNLKKIYYGQGSAPAKVAVKDVSVSIQHGEVFGLLGANGAGKTTLLKMVSGQELPTSGFALINGYDVVRNTSEAQRSMGLCPQFDTLIERLTVKENLLYFGQLKGLTGATLIEVCEAFMAAMNIKRYQNKLIQQLSGGNRRKVSLAVALLGAPPTVYLDEPSTGLDPVASRLMWRLLSRIAANKTTAMVLTTHNMLECEAVCTRICIMKLGEMVCLGDSQHLRSAHGTGFLLEMSLLNPTMIVRAKAFVEATFAQAVVVDEHSTMINFEIPRTSIDRLSQAFRQLEAEKFNLGIVDYSLSQSTLEQVFLKQIRPNDNDAKESEDQKAVCRVPTSFDYRMGYLMWLGALFLPGLHHFYLGNTMRGLKYMCTFNEVGAGWILDLFEMHILVQKSVQEFGHTTGCCCCKVSPSSQHKEMVTVLSVLHHSENKL